MTDSQIMNELFLEDLDSILNSGEITNLYLKEDQDRMAEELGPKLAKMKKPQTKDVVY
jgi:dynein heavy chain